MADRKLKIAQVITRMDKGGSSDIVRDLIGQLCEKHDIKLIHGPTSDPSRKTRSFLRAYRNNVIFLPVLRREINLAYDFMAFLSLWSIFKRESFDVVHCHTSKAGFLARLAAKMAGVKLIIYMPHGHIFYGYFGAMKTNLIVNAERFAASCCNMITTFTNLEKSDFERSRIAPTAKITVIAPGINFNELSGLDKTRRLATRNELKINEDEIAVGFVARLETVKGLEIFLDAAAIIVKKTSNVKFVVCGDGTLRNDVLGAQDILGNRLTFLGWREDNLNIINALDILIQPSLNEAVGRNIIEAQALGVAVVATKVGGIPEIITDGSTGLLCAPDPQQIAGMAQRLIDNPKLRTTLADNARTAALQRFDFARMTSDIEAIYTSIT